MSLKEVILTPSYIDDPDIPADPKEKAHFEKYGNITEFGIPLIRIKAQTFGVLEFWESERETRHSTDVEIEFAKLVARPNCNNH